MLEYLKEKVYIANQDLMDQAAYPFPWVSVSGIDREQGLVVMMPDGGAVTEEDMAVVDLQGRLLDGKEPPVRDMAVHLALYEAFPRIGSIAHPYSRWATVFAQLDLSIPVLGTVHADTFRGNIPVTGAVSTDMTAESDDQHVAQAIIRRYAEAGMTPDMVPAITITGQGAYTFGRDARTAVVHAVVLEEVAFLAYHTLQLDPGIRPIQLSANKPEGK